MTCRYRKGKERGERLDFYSPAGLAATVIKEEGGLLTLAFTHGFQYPSGRKWKKKEGKEKGKRAVYHLPSKPHGEERSEGKKGKDARHKDHPALAKKGGKEKKKKDNRHMPVTRVGKDYALGKRKSQ